jgi:predicted nucleotidyltransferase
MLPGMSARFRGLATAFYRQAAKVSARMLASSPMVESVLLHRSVATGEVCFGRSDIDMLLVVGREAAEDGEKIASLYRKVRRARVLNPALNHIDVYEPDGIASHARMDTFWGSTERRTLVLLRGKPVEIPFAPVQPDHAVSKFVLWAEWFVPMSVQRRNRRNLWKTSLESWNACATAGGLIAEPYLRRSEMEAHVHRAEGDVVTRRLEEPSYATRFVFGLADRLHNTRLPALRTLAKPLIFEAILAPLSLRRLFVVLPRADFPLPPEAFARGAFPCTPEVLHLFLHYKNAFLYWVLPPELLNLGMKPPSIPGFLRACRCYGHNRFLFHPGFADANPPVPAARTACIGQALEWAARGELPPAIPQEKMREMLTGAPSVLDYYRTAYGPLRRESQRLQESFSPHLDAAQV